MKFLRGIWLIAMFCGFTSFSSGQENPDSFTTITVSSGEYKNDHCAKKMKRSKKKLVMFAFFNFYHDTISIFIEDKLVFHKHVSKDTSVLSTDFTGVMVVAALPARKTKLSIVSAKEKTRVNTIIKRKYPVYTIHFYSPWWYIRPRKCFPVLK